MAEALWLQVAGVDYSAAEDRRLIKALSTAGVVEGLVITATSGTGISVSSGTAVIDTGTGEGYVAYTTAPTSLTLPVSSTTNVFIKVDTTTALVTVGQGTLPTAGTYLLLATVATGPASVTSAMPITPATRALPVNVAGKYLQLAGGVVTGEVQAARLLVSGKLGVGGVDTVPNMPLGARLGVASAATALCYARVDTDTPQSIPHNTWRTLDMTRLNHNRAYPGMAAPYNTGTNRFTCPVSGVYLVSGNVRYAEPAGANVGRRILSILRRNSATSQIWRIQGPQISGGVTDITGLSTTVDCIAGDTLEFQTYQSQGVALSTRNGDYPTNGDQTWGSFTLLQAF